MSKGHDGMPPPTSFDRVCGPKAIMESNARRRSTVCAVQRRCWHVTLDVVRLCVLYKGGDVMPRPTLFDRVSYPKAMMACHNNDVRPCVLSKGDDGMSRQTSSYHGCSQRAALACHARRHPTLCAIQVRLLHATPDVVRLFVLPKRDDSMPHPISSDSV